MASNALFAEIAALSGDPGRASMLHALMDGRALTATELARAAGITPQTASGHLQRMTAAGLLSVEKQGRHRYHRLAAPSIAGMLESIMQVAAELEPTNKKANNWTEGRRIAQSTNLLRPLCRATGRRNHRCFDRPRTRRIDGRGRDPLGDRHRLSRGNRHRSRANAGTAHEAIRPHSLPSLS
jgi:DNA-binding transcriptional ArsR family regulator